MAIDLRSPLRIRSLQARILALTLAILLPSICLIALTQYELVESRKVEVRESALLGARHASSEMERIASGIEAVLIAVSQAPVTRPNADDSCGKYLSRVAAQSQSIASLSIIDVSGSVRCTTLSPGREVNVSDQPYFKSALASRGRVIGDYTIGRISGKPILPIALAARDSSDQLTGVAVAAIDLDWLSETLKTRGLPPEGSVTVVDRNGVILARQPFPERFVGTRVSDEAMKLIDAPASGVETVTARDGTRRVVGYVPLSEPPIGLYVSVGLSAAASFEYIDRATRADAVFVCVATFATIVIAWLVGRRVFIQPLETIRRSIIRWRGGERHARTGFREGDDEIGALGAMIDELLDEIARAGQQRELVANELTHRVKNTFATVMAIANATFRKDDPARDMLPIFLARMNALSRTHDVLMGDRVEGADLERLIRGVVSPLCADVDAKFDFSGPAVELPPRVALAMTLVMHELCTNALKHGALSASGHIGIEWRLQASAAARGLDLTWRERGVGRVSQPAQQSKGFGARLIGVAFAEFGTSKLIFEPDAVVCVISITLPENAAAT